MRFGKQLLHLCRRQRAGTFKGRVTSLAQIFRHLSLHLDTQICEVSLAVNHVTAIPPLRAEFVIFISSQFQSHDSSPCCKRNALFWHKAGNQTGQSHTFATLTQISRESEKF
jgi:hypothetical protein